MNTIRYQIGRDGPKWVVFVFQGEDLRETHLVGTEAEARAKVRKLQGSLSLASAMSLVGSLGAYGVTSLM
jgi:hypothetical protein